MAIILGNVVLFSNNFWITFYLILLQHKNNRVNFELWTEAQAYGDIQLMPFVDYYSLISLKTIAICIMGVSLLRCYAQNILGLLLFISIQIIESTAYTLTLRKFQLMPFCKLSR